MGLIRHTHIDSHSSLIFSSHCFETLLNVFVYSWKPTWCSMMIKTHKCHSSTYIFQRETSHGKLSLDMVAEHVTSLHLYSWSSNTFNSWGVFFRLLLQPVDEPVSTFTRAKTLLPTPFHFHIFPFTTPPIPT